MSDDTMHDEQDPRSQEERRHDERLDALVRGLAVDYHRPGATPREEMWTRISAGLAAGGTATGIAGDALPGRGSGVAGVASASGGSGSRGAKVLAFPRFAAYAIAASLLLAAGIGIGMKVNARGGQQTIAQTTPVGRDGMPAATTDTARVTTPAPAEPPRMIAQHDERSATHATRDPRPDRSRNAVPVEPTQRAIAYNVATVAHLAQVEALLTSFRGDASNRTETTAQHLRADAQLAGWARDLLTNTRLLLDSPAAVDPLRRRLLEDLELVLVQIVQLSPGTAVDDRALIERTLSREHVLTRLRTAIPAGQTSGT